MLEVDTVSADTIQPITLVKGLLRPELYTPAVKECRLVETHISWVILAGPFVYKIKKSLDLGFLDFSSLEKRNFYCREELRLNKRLAPDIYLSVVPITGSYECPEWAGEGEVVDYAVKMRAFPQESQLDRALAGGELHSSQMDILAGHVADFHQQIEVAEKESVYGEPEQVHYPVEENFEQINEFLTTGKYAESLETLERWSQGSYQKLCPFFRQRKMDGFVRECHGDLHLGNIAWLDSGPLLFDCIEFSPGLRWIDVISDVAFLVMDLQDRKRPDLGMRFLNSYLEYTGDYGAMRLLTYYQVYRALVRAKIDGIRAHQPGISELEQCKAENEFAGYLQLALGYIQQEKPRLIITRGMSGSGKSTVGRQLLEQLGAVRIRSDVERKRLYGLRPEDDAQEAVGQGIYSTRASEKTYSKLYQLANMILDAGYSVIVDGVFMHHRQRFRFEQLAGSKGVDYLILECTAGLSTLKKRIQQRKNDASDAGLEVLAAQSSLWRPLKKNEKNNSILINTENALDIDGLIKEIKQHHLH